MPFVRVEWEVIGQERFRPALPGLGKVDLTAPWPEGYQPFAGAEYQPIDGFATAV